VSDHSNTFDPALKDAGIPPNVPSKPVGTVDELQDLGLDPAIFPSCQRPNKAAGIRGCDEYGKCPLSCKGKDSSSGGGPRRFAWERIFRGRPIRRVEGECWQLARDQEFVELNGGALRVIANEGETYEKLTGIAVKTFVDSEGNVQKVVAKDGEYHLPNVQREDRVVPFLVKPFPRPSQNIDLATDLITAEAVRKEHERIQREAVPRALGIEGTGEPLDKRNKGTRKGS